MAINMDCLVSVSISSCWDFKDYTDKSLEKCVNSWCAVLFNVLFWKAVCTQTLNWQVKPLLSSCRHVIFEMTVINW